jgi:pyruvate dehydrogenase E2 component (dihydrolipoamide acetyltransferase)
MAKKKNSTRRKLAIASWSSPKEGNIYGKLTIDMTEALKYIAQIREQTGTKVTVTHLVGVAIARALDKAPGLNGYLKFGKYIPHDTVNVAFLVALDGGSDLGKALVKDAADKSIVDFANELKDQATRLRAGKDDDFEKSKGLLRALPTWLLRPLLWLTGWLSGSLGVSIPALGITAFPFGSVIITNVGVFGLDEGWAPPTPFARVPVYVLLGAVRPHPAVIDGELTIRQQMTLCATIDHRFLDGAQGGILAKVIRDVLENPWQLDESEQATEVVDRDDADILGGDNLGADMLGDGPDTVESSKAPAPPPAGTGVIPDPGHVS